MGVSLMLQMRKPRLLKFKGLVQSHQATEIELEIEIRPTLKSEARTSSADNEWRRAARVAPRTHSPGGFYPQSQCPWAGHSALPGSNS